MNNKLLLQNLTDQLSELGKIKKKDAEEFVKAFFKVIEDTLFQGDIVKINGLGTFKLLKVEPRKSVNVSTGQEIKIKEHYKITFTPEQAIKDLVNMPFSFLEPVQLDGIAEKKTPINDQSDSEEKNIVVQPVETKKEVVKKEIPAKDIVKDTSVMEDVIKASSVRDSFVKDSSVKEDSVKKDVVEAEQVETSDKSIVEAFPDAEEYTNTDPVEDHTDYNDYIDSQQSIAIKSKSMTPNESETPDKRDSENSSKNDNSRYSDIRRETDSTSENEPGNEMKRTIPAPQRPIPAPPRPTIPKSQKPKSSINIVFWIMLLVLIASLGIWAYWSNQDATKEKQLKLNSDLALFDSTVYENVKESEFDVAVEDSLSVEAEIAAQIDSIAENEKPEVEKNVPKTKTSVTVTTVGVTFPLVVTMNKGDRLTMLALKYYGNKAFWVYIYAANRKLIPNPNNVPLGTKIRIPAPDLSRTDPDNPECIAKAKALQTKILTTLEN